MTAEQMFLLFRARSRFLWMTLIGFIVLAVVGSLLWPKTYLASVSVVIDTTSADPVSGNEQSPQLLPTNLATQLDVIASHNVALKVVDKLKLTENPYFKEKFLAATEGIGSIRDWIADRLLRKNLDAHLSHAQPTKQSNVIDIDLTSNEAQFSSDLANAFADAYIQAHLELKLEPARRQAAWFDDQLNGLRTALEAAQKRLSDYQRTKVVVGTDAKVDVENARLVEISNQLIAAQTAMYDGQTRLKQMTEALQNDQLQELPDIAGNTLLQTLKANLSVAEGKLAQISSSFGNNHPDYQSAEAQVKELRRKLLAEVEIARGSISQSAQISARQEAQLRLALEHQRDRVLELKRQQDDVDVLKAEVDNAQRAYDAGVQRATQVRLESRLDQSSIAILNPAIPPMFPAYPRLLLNVVIAALFGLIFGPSVVLALELLNPRVRSGNDVERFAGIVVLAELPRITVNAKRRKTLKALRVDPPFKPQVSQP